MNLRPVTSEKAVKLIEIENTLIFIAPRSSRKEEIKAEIELVFKVKVDKVRTHVKNNAKYAYVKLDKLNPAIDIATKLGMI